MINQQLLDYLKNQLSTGISQQDLKTRLMSEGVWSTADIEEAFNTIKGKDVSTATPQSIQSAQTSQSAGFTQTTTFGFLSFLIIPLLLILGLGAFVVSLPWETEINIDTSLESPGSVVRNCGTDWNCLIESARDCSLASFNNKVDSNLFGVNMKMKGVLEIRGEENGGCMLYGRNDKYDVTFPPETPTEIVDLTKNQYKDLEGKEYLCKFNTKEDLASVLTNWKVGNFDNEITCPVDGGECQYGGDFENAECSGGAFGQMSEINEEDFGGSVTLVGGIDDWKTYTDISGNLKINYPPSWEIVNMANDSRGLSEYTQIIDPDSKYGIYLVYEDIDRVFEFYKNLSELATREMTLIDYIRMKDALSVKLAPQQIADDVQKANIYLASTEKDVTSLLCPSNKLFCEAIQRQENPDTKLLKTYIHYIAGFYQIIETGGNQPEIYSKIISQIKLRTF